MLSDSSPILEDNSKFIQSLLGIVQLRIALVAHTAASAGAHFQEIRGVALDIARTGHAGRHLPGHEVGSKQVARTG